MVLEEHFVSGKDIPPLQAVGWEGECLFRQTRGFSLTCTTLLELSRQLFYFMSTGCFGFTILGFMLIPLYYIHVGPPISNSPMGRLEDLNDALVQIKNNKLLLMALIGT